MKKFGILALILGLSFSVVGCEAAKDKAEDAKKAAKDGVDNTVEKAKKGDMEGAKGEAGKGVNNVKKAVTGDGK